MSNGSFSSAILVNPAISKYNNQMESIRQMVITPWTDWYTSIDSIIGLLEDGINISEQPRQHHKTKKLRRPLQRSEKDPHPYFKNHCPLGTDEYFTIPTSYGDISGCKEPRGSPGSPSAARRNNNDLFADGSESSSELRFEQRSGIPDENGCCHEQIIRFPMDNLRLTELSFIRASQQKGKGRRGKGAFDDGSGRSLGKGRLGKRGPIPDNMLVTPMANKAALKALVPFAKALLVMRMLASPNGRYNIGDVIEYNINITNASARMGSPVNYLAQTPLALSFCLPPRSLCANDDRAAEGEDCGDPLSYTASPGDPLSYTASPGTTNAGCDIEMSDVKKGQSTRVDGNQRGMVSLPIFPFTDEAPIRRWDLYLSCSTPENGWTNDPGKFTVRATLRPKEISSNSESLSNGKLAIMIAAYQKIIDEGFSALSQVISGEIRRTGFFYLRQASLAASSVAACVEASKTLDKQTDRQRAEYEYACKETHLALLMLSSFRETNMAALRTILLLIPRILTECMEDIQVVIDNIYVGIKQVNVPFRTEITLPNVDGGQLTIPTNTPTDHNPVSTPHVPMPPRPQLRRERVAFGLDFIMASIPISPRRLVSGLQLLIKLLAAAHDSVAKHSRKSGLLMNHSASAMSLDAVWEEDDGCEYSCEIDPSMAGDGKGKEEEVKEQRIRKRPKKSRLYRMLKFMRSFVGIKSCVTFIVLLLIFCSIEFFSVSEPINDSNRVGWFNAATHFTVTLSLILLQLMLGLCVIVWEVAGVNYPFLFNLDFRYHWRGMDLIRDSCIYTCLWVTHFYAFIRTSNGGNIYAIYFAYTLYFTLGILWAFMYFVRKRPGGRKMWLLPTLSRIVRTPFLPVVFSDIIITGLLVTTGVIWARIGILWCYFSIDSVDEACLWTQETKMEWIKLFPISWRGLQCLRNYVDTPSPRPLFPHIINSFNYLVSIFAFGCQVAYAMGVYYLNDSSHPAQRGLTILFFVAKSLESIYHYAWDVAADCGLKPYIPSDETTADFEAGRVSSRIIRAEGRAKVVEKILHWKVRPLLFPLWFYVIFIIYDFLGNWFWIVGYFAEEHFARDAQWLPIMMVAVAVVQRFLWVLVRVENDQVNNIELYKLTQQAPLLAKRPLRHARGDWDVSSSSDEDEYDDHGSLRTWHDEENNETRLGAIWDSATSEFTLLAVNPSLGTQHSTSVFQQPSTLSILSHRPSIITGNSGRTSAKFNDASDFTENSTNKEGDLGPKQESNVSSVDVAHKNDLINVDRHHPSFVYPATYIPAVKEPFVHHVPPCITVDAAPNAIGGASILSHPFDHDYRTGAISFEEFSRPSQVVLFFASLPPEERYKIVQIANYGEPLVSGTLRPYSNFTRECGSGKTAFFAALLPETQVYCILKHIGDETMTEYIRRIAATVS